MLDKEYMTLQGRNSLEQRILALEDELKELRIYKGEEAVHAGDMWHDNPVLYEVEARERVLMRSIAELRAKVDCAELIEPPGELDCVKLGCEVKIRFPDGSMESYKILGEADSKPDAGIISYRSPLARALLNHHIGDRVTYEVDSFSEELEIITITRAI